MGKCFHVKFVQTDRQIQRERERERERERVSSEQNLRTGDRFVDARVDQFLSEN